MTATATKKSRILRTYYIVYEGGMVQEVSAFTEGHARILAGHGQTILKVMRKE